ncbi:MAG: aminotransferase class V-fold PLP-dependent enzyme [Nitrospinae bacterium]|nr:aminotransferase class V-fold PLP-dependent enzyme [Nitrospinota bacterium]
MSIYLDNAATSFPKPEAVYTAVNYTLQKYGSSPGRGGHKMSMQTDRIIFDVRERIASFFNIPSSSNVIFTFNVTMGINLALKGILKAGDHVITSSMEHNSVMRPLKRLEKEGVAKTVVKCSKEGFLNPNDIEKEIKSNTKLIVITHASNVVGTIMPIQDVGEIARKKGIVFLLDAAQSAGLLPIDVQKDNIDILACTGHKSLFGPQGTGFLYIKDGLDVEPLIEGGTGSNSESDEMPDFLPDKFQGGTLNTPGIAGLGAGIEFIQKEGLQKIRNKELHFAAEIMSEFKKIKGVKLYGSPNPAERVSVVSFNIGEKDPAEVGNILNEKYDIMSRVGLHCAPNAHRTIGTFPVGTVRVSVGYFNTEEDIERLIKAVRDITS